MQTTPPKESRMADAKSDKKQALELAISQIERQFGKGSVMRLGARGPLEEIAVIPTGALPLDVALGIGGLPRGRVVEIYGPESSGKTTLALHAIAEAQRLGGIAAFIDAEHALDPIYANKLGLNTDELLISQPDTGEQALEITETLVRSNAVDVIVIDSVAALVPRAELDGDMGDSLPGLQARLMSQALRKLTAAISRSGVVVIFINQIREKIGVMFGCFSHDTRVVLADGSTEEIGKIVSLRLPVEVLSCDPATGQVEPRRVVNWFDNGETDHFLQFEVEDGSAPPRRFAATENHLIFTPGGPVKAGDLDIGDEVLVGGENGARPARIASRYARPPAQGAHRFDLEVEGHHTYLVDGVVVHNSPETTSGGRALKFYASVRLDIRRQDAIKSGTESLGVRTKVKVVKNKLAPPFREAEFDVIYGEGISKSGTILDAGVEQGIIEKSGTWYTYKNERIGQGRENAKKWLQENAAVLTDLEAKIREALGLRPVVPLNK
jgi:RecA/RadA recombinase